MVKKATKSLMSTEDEILMIAEYMQDPLWISWKTQKMGGPFPYYLLPYHQKWHILKPVIERLSKTPDPIKKKYGVGYLLSRSIADPIDEIYPLVVLSIKYLKAYQPNA